MSETNKYNNITSIVESEYNTIPMLQLAMWAKEIILD